jgi:outer membrane protein OmpA-like peptidoglycan-associated protein
VETSWEIVTTTETQIAGAKVGDIHFGFDKFDVRPEHQADLNKLSDFLKNNPGAEVVLARFTDKVGSEEYNLPLSQRRGRASPTTSSSRASEGRAKNRRVGVAVGMP